MCVSDEMVNWKKSSLSKDYFIDKMLRITSQVDWCTKYSQKSEQILGCVSKRRES